jgi:hypothetical protein
VLEAFTSRIAQLAKITHSSCLTIMQTRIAPHSLPQLIFAATSEAFNSEFPLVTHSGSQRLANRQQCYVPAPHKSIDIIKPRVLKPTRQDSCHQVPDSASLPKPGATDVLEAQAPSNLAPTRRARDTLISFHSQTPYTYNRDTIILSNIRASTVSNLSHDFGSIQKYAKATLHVANVAGPIAVDTYMQPPPVREFTGAYAEDLSRSLVEDSGLLDKGRKTRQLHREMSAMIVYKAKDRLRKVREQVSNLCS